MPGIRISAGGTDLKKISSVVISDGGTDLKKISAIYLCNGTDKQLVWPEKAAGTEYNVVYDSKNVYGELIIWTLYAHTNMNLTNGQSQIWWYNGTAANLNTTGIINDAQAKMVRWRSPWFSTKGCPYVRVYHKNGESGFQNASCYTRVWSRNQTGSGYTTAVEVSTVNTSTGQNTGDTSPATNVNWFNVSEGTEFMIDIEVNRYAYNGNPDIGFGSIVVRNGLQV